MWEDNEITKNLIANSEEQRFEASLRPEGLAEIIGLSRIKQNLSVMIEAANQRTAALDHLLFHGPPGLGKTSLAMAVAKDMGMQLVVTSGPALTKPAEIASMLTAMPSQGILFIDEIHRLRLPVEEMLYSAMEDKCLDIIIGKGAGARSIRIDLPDFTIIGATTRLSMLSAPLRSRFGADFRVEFYSVPELAQIIEQKAQKLGITIDRDAAELIAGRARMTARVAVRILKRARDLALVDKHEVINVVTVRKILAMLDIDGLGLDKLDRGVLHTIYVKYNNRPVGLRTIAASMSEDADTIEEVCEPFLLQLGLLDRSPRGRVLTQNAVEYIQANPQLFDL
jgi:Holliday junction DNA helicase RuvB